MPAGHHIFMDARCVIVLMDIMVMADVFFIICTAIIISYFLNPSMKQNDCNRKLYGIYMLTQHEYSLYFVEYEQKYKLSSGVKKITK